MINTTPFPVENTTDFISVRVTTGNAGSRSIQLSAVDDDIANENDERFTLQFVSSFGPEIFDVVENLGEFLRDTATVIIIDSDCK